MRALKPLILFGVGGFLYIMFELIYRGYSHWTMFIVGGICFLLLGAINEYIPWKMPLIRQCILGACIITIIEFIAGCIINLWLGWDVWDYSDVTLNIMGQVCLPFFFLWIFISAIGIVVDDYLRYWIFGEEKPAYKLL